MKLYIVALAALALVGCTKNLESDYEFDQLRSQALLTCQDKQEGTQCSFGVEGGPQYEGACVSYRRTQMVCHASNVDVSSDAADLEQICADKQLGDQCRAYRVTGEQVPGSCLVNEDGNLFCARNTHRGNQSF